MNKKSGFSKLLENLRQAFETLRSHKMRSSLVVLGVGIGVTTLMGMVTILLGLGGKISADLRSSDNTVVYLSKFDLLVGGDPRKYAHRPEITPEDMHALRTEVPSVRLVDFQQNPNWGTQCRAQLLSKWKPKQWSKWKPEQPAKFAALGWAQFGAFRGAISGSQHNPHSAAV